MTKIIKIGLIGAGRWGPNLIGSLRRIEGVEIKHVADQSKEAIQKIVKRFDCIIPHEDPQSLIGQNELDAVLIATPVETHFSLAKEVLNSGKNVFVEKPLCLSLKDAREIEKVANKFKRIVFTGHLLQYHNAFRELKQNIKLGKIGHLQVIKANRLNFGAVRKIESVLYDLASHDLSMILSIADKLPVKVDVNAVFKNSKTIPDYMNIILYFKKNLTAILNVDWISPYKEHRFSVFGSKGSLIFDDTENWKNKLIFNPSYLNKKNEVVYKPNVSILIQEEEPLKKEIESFLNCIQYGETPVTDIKEAINVQIVLNKIENKLIKKYG